MKHVSEKHLEEFVAACHRVASYGLVRCGSGNLSWRVDEKYALITETRTWMAELTKDQIVIFRIADRAELNDKRASEESGFHLGILRRRSDVNVVLHFQTPCATAAGCRVTDLKDFSVIPEIPFHIGPISVLPYMDPGAKDLTEAVVSAMEACDLVILRNHGQVTVGKSFDDAIQKASFFELACEIILRAGDQIQFLSKEAVDRLSQKKRGHQSDT